MRTLLVGVAAMVVFAAGGLALTDAARDQSTSQAKKTTPAKPAPKPEELDKLLKDGVDAKELEEAKKAYLEQLKVQRTNDTMLAGQLANGLHTGRTFFFYTDLEKKVSTLTPPQVSEAVRKHFDPKRLVIIEFDSFDQAKGWYESEHYGPARELRQRTANSRLIAVEGVD